MTKPQRSPRKKGPSKGTGGLGRRALEGKGPTPKAEDRSWHPAGKRKASRERFEAASAKGRPARCSLSARSMTLVEDARQNSISIPVLFLKAFPTLSAILVSIEL